MIDFAKYAFNKSHAAAYAVVAYQTAWLKYYYPVEFMAALMTSVIDNPGKVSEYIYDLPSDGHRHSARRISTTGEARLFRGRRRHPLRAFRHQEHGPFL